MACDTRKLCMATFVQHDRAPWRAFMLLATLSRPVAPAGRILEFAETDVYRSHRHADRDPRDLRADARPGQAAGLCLPSDQRDLEPDAECRAARVRRRRERR